MDMNVCLSHALYAGIFAHNPQIMIHKGTKFSLMLLTTSTFIEYYCKIYMLYVGI